MMACLHFLDTPDENLDTGFALPLKKLALSSGAQSSAHLRYLLSEPVQQAISLAFQSSAVSSLPVERAFAQTKQQEAPRLCHVATASRNQIIRQFLRQRGELLHEASSSAAALRSSLKTNVASLAWELQPRLADLALSHNGSQPMKEFIAIHRPALQAEVQRRKTLAQSVSSRFENQEFPLTHSQWISWFRRNQDEFYSGMLQAGHQRRAANRRLQASADTPPPVMRGRPAKATLRAVSLKPWQQILHRRSGWFILKDGNSEVRLLFVFTFKGHSYCIDFSVWRRRREFCIVSGDGFNLDDIIISLAEVEGSDHIVVMEAAVDMQSAPVGLRAFSAASAPAASSAAPAPVLLPTPAGQVSIAVVKASVLTEPLTVPRKSRKRKDMGTTEDGDLSCSSDSDEHMAQISSASSHASVDTDVDSGVDDYVDGKDMGGELDAEGDEGLLAFGGGDGTVALAY